MKRRGEKGGKGGGCRPFQQGGRGGEKRKMKNRWKSTFSYPEGGRGDGVPRRGRGNCRGKLAGGFLL